MKRTTRKKTTKLLGVDALPPIYGAEKVSTVVETYFVAGRGRILGHVKKCMHALTGKTKTNGLLTEASAIVDAAFARTPAEAVAA